MPLYAELHRHLGGSVVPRVFWRYLQRNHHPLAEVYPVYEQFEAFVTHPRSSLAEYLELHSLIEPFQTLETLPYFISKLVRGAYVFEGICYLELRHTPYYRTNHDLPVDQRITQMREVIKVIGEAGKQRDYPLIMSQIVCMHSRLPYDINLAILNLAVEMPEYVCGIDLAGPDIFYRERIHEFVQLYQRATELGIKTTGHLYETVDGCIPELLPYLKRIGHGIQIPLRYPDLLPELAERGQCLEVCPTTYLKTGTLSDLDALQIVFERCLEAGVDVTICTDNAGLHNVRLPWEYENLLTQDVIDFHILGKCQDAAFKHAFAWPHNHPPRAMLDQWIIGQG